ncbi:MAG: SHOCT domain-containing protein [Rhodospirillales bacterium]|nr:SHOCT domain-containing protein [Rhodospirillales bacterium]
MWGSGMIFGPLVMIGFIVLTVFFVVMIIRWMGGTSNAPSNLAVKSALEILNERYAKGEIDKDEYEERKLTLSS